MSAWNPDSKYLPSPQQIPRQPTEPLAQRSIRANIDIAEETLPPLDHGDCYTDVSNTIGMALTADLERTPAVQWRRPRDKAREHLDFLLMGIKSEINPFRDSAINALLRFTRTHIGSKGAYAEEIFDAARWLLQHSHETCHIGNRAMAGKTLAHVGPFLRRATPELYETAAILRIAATKQLNDATDMINAYHQLVHCLQPDHVEVAEGIATFNGLATEGRSDDIRRTARKTYDALTALKSGFPGSGNTSATSSGGMTGGGACKGPDENLFATNLVPHMHVFLATSGIITMNSARRA